MTGADAIDGARRRWLGGAAASAIAGAAQGAPASRHPLRWPAGDIVELWPDGRIPGAPQTLPQRAVKAQPDAPGPGFRLLSGVDRPFLALHRAPRPDGSAALVLPGGSYEVNAFDYEGVRTARWLAARGTTAAILVYRLPNEGWAQRAVVPLQDAQRAMRLLRARSAGLRIDPGRVAAIGFSAGGHLCGSLATRADEAVYAPLDEADRLSARPQLAGLIYPVVTLTPPFAHPHSAERLLGLGASREALERGSVERRIDGRTPPLFLAHAGDDASVPVENSLMAYDAARRAGVPAELHLFAEGDHGFKSRNGRAPPATAWPSILSRMALAQGMFRTG